MLTRRVLVLLAFLAPATPAQTAQGDTARVPTAAPAFAASIVLDGHAREAGWSAAVPIADFRQHDPDVGAPATERTEVRVLFDSTTLYVHVHAYDAEPDRVIARILARDRLMVLDEFSGQLLFAGDDGIAILLDPFRDRRNAVVFATNANGAEFEAQITDQGREVNIAWRTVWRVAAARTDSGWSAEFAIPFRSLRYPKDGRAWGINVYRVISRKNEQVMWRSWSRDNAGFLKVSEAGELPGIRGLGQQGLGLEVKTSAIGRAVRGDVDGRSRPADVALDLKYEARPGVTLDVTANTDFAQADVDDVQINLTRFDLFFPEKRDFFLENAGVLDFGTRGIFEPPPWLMFFSRRIGISDSGEVPVLGGVRLTGREGAQTFGLLAMATDHAPFDIGRNYGVARFKRDVGGGFVGAMYTEVRERGAPARIGARAPRAHSYGADFELWPSATTNVQGFVAAVGGDSLGGEARDGVAHRLMLNREVERWGLRLERIVVDPDADPAMGFATRTDVQRNDATLRITFRPGALGLRRIESFNFAQYIARTDGALQDWGVGPALGFTFDSGDEIVLFRLQAFTVLDESFDLADRLLVQPGRYQNSQTGMFITTASRRPVSFNAQVQHQPFYGGSLLLISGTLNVALGARGQAGLTRVFNDAQVPAGRLITNVSALRLGYTFSTKTALSTTVQYDALDQVLNANARFVWQYRPGSELFIVLNEEREQGIARALQPRTALLKLTYLARL